MRSLFCAFGILAAGLAIAGPAAAQADKPVVVIETSLGDVTVELDREKAPLSVENFLSYVKDGHYAGTIFHRVIRGFMIQGGGVTADMQRKPTKPPIKNEATNGLKNRRGTIAMARTAEPDSASAQFFINTVDNDALDHKGTGPRDYGYAVFGKVVSGMDVVDKIERVAINPTMKDVPAEPVTIKNIRLKS
jgi:cyclophilin family peptidyl-prolyl cis-trans isomerase